jgi:hypothetical protein
MARLRRFVVDVPLTVDEVLAHAARVDQVVERALRPEQLVRATLLRGMAGAVPTDTVQQADKLGDLPRPSHAWMQIAPLLGTSG